MSQIKAKQLKLSAEGDLLIGGANGKGTVLSAAANDDKILRVVDGSPVWSVNDNLKSVNTFNTVAAIDDTGVSIKVQNSDESAAVELAKFNSGSAADERFEFSSSAGSLSIAAAGTAADVDILLTPKGAGEVVIGTTGGGVIQASDDEDLKLLGGSGAGNLFLNGGGTGKIYYGESVVAGDEIATVGDISTAVSAASVSQTRNEYAGDAASFALNAKTVDSSVIAFINGLVVPDSNFAVDATTKVVTFSDLPYALDGVDQVVFTYEVTA